MKKLISFSYNYTFRNIDQNNLKNINQKELKEYLCRVYIKELKTIQWNLSNVCL